MWHISGYRHELVLYVQILLYEVQELAFLTKIHIHHNQNSSWQWTKCRCVVCYTSHIDHPKSKIFTLVLEIHEDVDLVVGIKNLFELEGVIDSWDSCVKFMNRSIPFFPREKDMVQPREQKVLTLEALFV